MNCPHCGWNLKVTREWVAADGYHAEFECRYATCEVKVSANTNLFWAYENNKIKISLRPEAHDILQARGMIATPP